MKIVKLLLPGDFEDAFLYKGTLVAITVERSVEFFDLHPLIARLGEQLQEGDSFLPMLFLQNQWLRGQQFKLFMRNRVVSSTFLSFLDSLPDTIEVDDPGRYKIEQEPLSPESKAILDLNIYKDRLYVGLDKGCFQRDYNWGRFKVEPKGEMSCRFDARCMGISTGYGALNLSCGDSGLFTFADVFDWDTQINSQDSQIQLASSSLRSSWMHENLMNYSTPALPELFRGNSSSGSKHRLVEVENERIPLDDLLGQVKHEHGVKDEDIQFSFNSDKTMFVHTYDGRFFGIEVNWRKGTPPKPKLTKTYKGGSVRILSAAFCQSVTAIETEDRVLGFANGTWNALLDDEVISLRTFPEQSQFQNMVLAVVEGGIVLISLFEDKAYRRPEH